jgi:hypothetical protein
MFRSMTSTVQEHDATSGQADGALPTPRQPGTGGIHEWMPYAITALAAVLVVLLFVGIGRQHTTSATKAPVAGGGGSTGGGSQLTTGLVPTSFSATCTLTKGPGYQTVAGQITSNASAKANVTLTYDLLDAAGTRVLGGTKPFNGVVKGTPTPWQAPERGLPAAATCVAKVTGVTAAG